MSDQTRPPPARVFPLGPIGEIAVWDNSFEKDGKRYTRFAAEPIRKYRDKDGNWQESRSIPTQEMAAFIDGLRDAHTWMKAVERGDISIHEE